MKRKSWEIRDCNIDLNLSLSVLNSGSDDRIDMLGNVDSEDGDNSLSLSLFPSSCSKLSKLDEEGDHGGKRAKMASILDLTL